MEDGAVCAGEVSGTLHEGVVRVVSWIFGESAVKVCNPLGPDAWLLFSAFDKGCISFLSVVELIDDVAANEDGVDNFCLLSFVLSRRSSAVIPGLACGGYFWYNINPRGVNSGSNLDPLFVTSIRS